MQTVGADLLRESHGKRMDDILMLLGDMSSWYQTDENEEAQTKSKAFTELREKLMTGEYTIVMVGEFSAGKSTLLNALMGENLLPAYTNETTATVNFLRHAEQATQGEKGCVHYSDEQKRFLERVDYDTIQQYVSTRGENVVSSVAHLDLFLDSEFLRDNVTLIDSPGLNGVAEGHANITNDQILESHACIFVFNATQPGSKSNFEFLANLKSNVGTILFVLNRIDEINASEGDSPESVIAKIQESYQKFFPDNECPEIWPLAAKPALVARSKTTVEYRNKTEFHDEDKSLLLASSRIQGFETRLMEFLTKGEKTKRQALEPVTRTLEVGNRSKADIEKEIDLLTKADDTGELEKNIIAVQDAIKNCEKELQSCYADVSSKVRVGLRDVVEAIDADIIHYTERVISDINSYDNLDDLNDYLNNITSEYSRYVKSRLSNYDATLRNNIIDQVFCNYQAFAERIQKGFGDDSSLVIAVELHTKEYTFQAGLATMEQQEDEMKQQLELLRRKEEEAKKDNLSAQMYRKKQEKIEKQLSELTDRHNEITDRIMPTIVQTTKREERTKTAKEKGIVGCVGELFTGEKTKIVDVLVTDDLAFRAESAQRDADLQSVQAEKIKLEYQLDDSAEETLVLSHEALTRKQANLDRLEEKYLELIKENREKFQNKYHARLQKARIELRNTLDDKTEEVIGEVKKILRNQEKKYAGIVNSVIMANLKQDLLDQQKKQENLQLRLHSSEQERDERIATLTERFNQLDVILNRALSLKNELEGLHIEDVS